ncbi:MAG: hypothetical protein ACTS73_04890 [Arsenophonus sp. NEOnobi-MAG3]
MNIRGASCNQRWLLRIISKTGLELLNANTSAWLNRISQACYNRGSAIGFWNAMAKIFPDGHAAPTLLGTQNS